MKNKIEEFFHPNYKDKLEKELENLGQREISWIMNDVKEANSKGDDFKITEMQFNSKNKTINLHLLDESSKKSIARDLIL
jgi:hypothetical protein